MDTNAGAQTHTQAAGGPAVGARGTKTREEVVNSEQHRDLSTPKLGPGDPAFDFSLPLLDPHRGLTPEIVRLSDYAGQKPVALIFGSYT